LNEGVRIYVATSLAAYGANPKLLTNITPQFVEDPVLNSLSYITMNSPTGTANIGVRHLAEGALNPIGGWKDAYAVQTSSSVALPLIYYQPATGYDYAIGFAYKLNSISPTANTSLPSSALMYNYTSGKFVHPPNGTMARVAVDVNYAPLFKAEKWSDGQSISLADLLYQYVVYENASLNTNSSIYDGYANAVYASSFAPVIGFRVLNSTSLEIYSNYYYPDYNFAALNDATLEPTLGDALPGGSMMPWQLFQAMANVVSSGKAAWSTSSATAKSIDWLSLVSPTDLGYVGSQLSTLTSESYVPPQLAQLQNLTGVPMTNASFAAAGYSALSSFITKYGNAVVSDGPYIISQWQTSTTPNYAVLTKNPNFTSTIIPSALFASATSISVSASPPSIVASGSNFNVTTLSTVIGTNHTAPQPGVNMVIEIVGNGTVVSQASTISGNNGQAIVTVPATLSAGTYTLIVYASSNSSKLIDPFQTTITVIGTASNTSSTSSVSTTVTTSATGLSISMSSSSSTTSSSMSIPSTTSSSSSSTTSSSSNSTTSANNGSTTTLEVASVVVVIIIVVGAFVALRRRGGTTSAPT